MTSSKFASQLMAISDKKNCDFVGSVRFRSRKDAMENFTELLKNLACQNTLDFSWQQCSAEVLKVAHNLGNLLYLYSGLEMQNCQLQKLTWYLTPATWPSTIRQIPDLGQICGFETVCGKIEMHFLRLWESKQLQYFSIRKDLHKTVGSCHHYQAVAGWSKIGWIISLWTPRKLFSSRNFNFSSQIVSHRFLN